MIKCSDKCSKMLRDVSFALQCSRNVQRAKSNDEKEVKEPNAETDPATATETATAKTTAEGAAAGPSEATTSVTVEETTNAKATKTTKPGEWNDTRFSELQ